MHTKKASARTVVELELDGIRTELRMQGVMKLIEMGYHRLTSREVQTDKTGISKMLLDHYGISKSITDDNTKQLAEQLENFPTTF